MGAPAFLSWARPYLNNVVTLKNVGLVVTTDAEGRYSFKDATNKIEASVSQDRHDENLLTQVGYRVRRSEATSANVITFGKAGYSFISRNVESIEGIENVVLTLDGKVTYVCSTADTKGKWQIARTVYDQRRCEVRPGPALCQQVHP